MVDDGSSLDMKSTIAHYSNKLCLRYFWQEDRGFRPGTARNMGIKVAKGEVCVFLDCGVIVTSNCLEEHFRIQKEHGLKTVLIGYVLGNDTHSDLKEMRDIIDAYPPRPRKILCKSE